MKARGNMFYAILIGVAVAIPVVGHSVTLSSTAKTPCFFGALGSAKSCAQARSTDLARGILAAPTVQTTSILAAPVTVPVSDIVTVQATAPATSTTPSSVPLPFGALLLLASLGLMVFVNRKKA